MYLYAAIATLPILFTIIFMAVFNWPAKRALPFSWLIACLVAGFVWKMDFLKISARTISEIWKIRRRMESHNTTCCRR